MISIIYFIFKCFSRNVL